MKSLDGLTRQQLENLEEVINAASLGPRFSVAQKQFCAWCNGKWRNGKGFVHQRQCVSRTARKLCKELDAYAK